VLSFSTTGCTPKGKDKKPAAVDASSSDKVEKKDGKVALVKIKHGTVVSWSIEPSKKGLKDEKDGENGVKITVEKAADLEKSYTIKIKAKGEDDKEIELTHKIAIEGGTPSPPAKESAHLEKEEVKLVKKDGEKTWIKVMHGKITDVTIEPVKGVKLEKDETTVTVSVEKLADVADKYKVMIKAKGDDEKVKELTATIEVVAPPKKVEPVAVDLVVDEKTVPKDGILTIEPKDDTSVTIKFSKGEVDSVSVDPKDKGVTVEGKKDWVKITVAKDAKEGDVTIKVKAVGEGAKGAEWKLKVKKVEEKKKEKTAEKTGFLNDRQDERALSTIRRIEAVATERFAIASRRM